MRESTTNRRTFLSQGAVATVAASQLASFSNAHAAGSDVIKVGLIGCGGRGTGAAEQALTADSNTRLVAMGDAFPDAMEASLNALSQAKIARQVEVPKDRQYVGFDAYKNVIDQCDVAILTTPPGFRPIHLAYAVEKGVHAFVEKPVAVDAPGVRKVLELCKQAKEKNLSLVSGLCWRYHTPRRETMKQVFDGKIGDIVAIETTYNSGGVWEPRKRRDECSSDMEYQMRNWYYYRWLSGDHIAEQAVHGIDTMAWAMGDKPPTLCWGSGGRQVRTDEKYGNIWDHFSVVYEYPGGVRGYHTCRHWRGTEQRVKDYVLGAKGMCDVFGNRISGENAWRYRGPAVNMYQIEHDEMYAALRGGKRINNVEKAATSSLLAIMGRMAAYTGQAITWEQALNSEEKLVPDKFQWGEAPQHPLPRPGLTKFV